MTLIITNLQRRALAFSQKDFSPTNSGLNSSNADMANVKVAMLPMTFQNWSRLCILREIMLPDSVSNDRHCVTIPMVTRRRAKAEKH